MALDSELTILLTLRDRTAFTHRWMSYHDGIAFPFKVLVADGGSDDAVAKLLHDKARFPALDYEYVRYVHDASYSDFYAKVDDALSRIGTPFVAMADNDDFYVAGGLKESVTFLSAHPDYATCGGQCAIFWIAPAPAGAEQDFLHGRQIDWKCSCDAQSLANATARQRVRSQSLRASYPIYYHVQRTEELRRQFGIVRKSDPKDLFMVEQTLCFLSAIAGKTRQLESLFIARQQNAPGSSGGAHQEKYGDWLERMLQPTWSNDFGNFLDVTSKELAGRDGIAIDEAQRWITDCYRMAVAPALLADLLEEKTITAPMTLAVLMVRRLVGLPPDSVLRKLARRVYRGVRWISVDAVHGTELRTRRVANARREFESIREFLSRQPETPMEMAPLPSAQGIQVLE